MTDEERKAYRDTIEKAAIATGVSPNYVEICIKNMVAVFDSKSIVIGKFHKTIAEELSKRNIKITLPT